MSGRGVIRWFRGEDLDRFGELLAGEVDDRERRPIGAGDLVDLVRFPLPSLASRVITEPYPQRVWCAAAKGLGVVVIALGRAVEATPVVFDRPGGGEEVEARLRGRPDLDVLGEVEQVEQRCDRVPVVVLGVPFADADAVERLRVV